MQGKSLWAATLVTAMLVTAMLVAAPSIHAQSADMYKDRIRTWSSISPLPDAVFGERYDLYKGELSFHQEDLRLPGIGPDIVVGRTFLVGGWQAVVGPKGFEDWEITIPRLVTRSTASAIWEGAYSASRCTNFGAQPANTPPYFLSREWWNGIQLVDQNGNMRDAMRRRVENTLAPDGLTSTYKGVTKDFWQFSCLSQTANGQPGEGMLGLAPDGTKYWFDWLVLSDQHDGLEEYGADGKWHNLNLYKAMLLVTRIEDRFGNYLTYAYDGKQIQSISGSDGRLVSFTWAADGRHITNITSAGHTWDYQYASPPVPNYHYGGLKKLLYPDGTSMQFNLGNLFDLTTEQSQADCNPAPTGADLFIYDQDPTLHTGTITGPSGLIGTFTLQQTLRGRTKVPAGCNPDNTPSISVIFATKSLVKRQYTGPGSVNRIWQYQYSTPVASWASCTTCSVTTASSTVINPDGSVSRSTYSTEWGANEGKLLLLEEGVTGSGALRTTTYQYAPTDGMAYPALIGVMPLSFASIDNDKPAQTYSPVWKKTVTQQGRTFIWQVASTCGSTGASLCFDQYARPTNVVKSSTP